VRTLLDARAALHASSRDPWARIAASRPIRRAWAASVTGLIVAHLLVPSPPAADRGEPALPLTVAAAQPGELADVVRLGRLTAELPGWEIAAPSDRTQASERTPS
jgi:hypothetical protein